MDPDGHLPGQKLECILPVFKAGDRIGLQRVIVDSVNFEIAESWIAPEHFVCLFFLASNVQGYKEPVFHCNPIGYGAGDIMRNRYDVYALDRPFEYGLCIFDRDYFHGAFAHEFLS